MTLSERISEIKSLQLSLTSGHFLLAGVCSTANRNKRFLQPFGSVISVSQGNVSTNNKSKVQKQKLSCCFKSSCIREYGLNVTRSWNLCFTFHRVVLVSVRLKLLSTSHLISTVSFWSYRPASSTMISISFRICASLVQTETKWNFYFGGQSQKVPTFDWMLYVSPPVFRASLSRHIY